MLRSFLSPGHLLRIQEYEQIYQANHGVLPSDPAAPEQLTHGLYYSFRQRRLILGVEHLLANGWNIGMGGSYVSPLTPLLSKMSERDLKGLSGNGMNLQMIGAWVLYCAMNVKRKEADKLREEHKLSSGNDLAELFEDKEEGEEEDEDLKEGDVELEHASGEEDEVDDHSLPRTPACLKEPEAGDKHFMFAAPDKHDGEEDVSAAADGDEGDVD